MHDQIERFQESLLARKLSAATVRPYVGELRRLAAWLDAQGVPLDAVDRHHVTRYAAGNDFASATANRQLVVLRQFFSWLEHPVAPALAGMRAPRVERPVPEFLTGDEERQLRRTLKDRTDQRHQARDRALVCLLLDTGLRVAEVVGLDRSDVDLGSKRVLVRTKGGKSRSKFLSAESRQLLSMLLTNKTVNDSGADPVFRAQGGGARLTDRQVRRIVAGWARLAGIAKDVHPHTMRHTFATSLLSRTGNLRLVQRALDHESPQTTAIYAHVVDEELKAAMEGRMATVGTNDSI